MNRNTLPAPHRRNLLISTPMLSLASRYQKPGLPDWKQLNQHGQSKRQRQGLKVPTARVTVHVNDNYCLSVAGNPMTVLNVTAQKETDICGQYTCKFTCCK